MNNSTLINTLNQWADIFDGTLKGDKVTFNNSHAKGSIKGYKCTDYLEIFKFEFDLFTDFNFVTKAENQEEDYIAIILGNPLSGKLNLNEKNLQSTFELSSLGAFLVNFKSDLSWSFDKSKSRKMISVRIKRSMFEKYIKKSETLIDKYGFDKTFYVQENFTPRMIEIFERFFSIEEDDMFATEMSEVYAKYLSSEFFRKLAERDEAQTERKYEFNVQPILRTKEILENVIDKPVLIDDLTKEVGLSESRLRVLFKEVFGTTIHQYHQDVRLNKSRELLLKSNKTMSMIASDLGYSSSSHFSMVFKKRFNITPKDFKRDPQYAFA